MKFEWDSAKEAANLAKHGVDFSTVEAAWYDPHRLLLADPSHSRDEWRGYCIGHDGLGILTVRFSLRLGSLRIIGAGYWRKGKHLYEKANLH